MMAQLKRLEMLVFLIHYGWRGTGLRYSQQRHEYRVSNPLRLEGDGRPDHPRAGGYVVSNPLRLEGDGLGSIVQTERFDGF